MSSSVSSAISVSSSPSASSSFSGSPSASPSAQQPSAGNPTNKSSNPPIDHSTSSYASSSHPPSSSSPSPSPSASSSSPLHRPNKYHGPASTWRSWAAAEISLSNSLDKIRAQDLAVHLYNAHALKRRARDLIERGEQGVWTVPKVWTAWPMDSKCVPREGERGRWGDDEFRVGREGERREVRVWERSRETLEECLVAEVLREAKERVWAWEGEQRGEEEIKEEGSAGEEEEAGQEETGAEEDTDEEGRGMEGIEKAEGIGSMDTSESDAVLPPRTRLMPRRKRRRTENLNNPGPEASHGEGRARSTPTCNGERPHPQATDMEPDNSQDFKPVFMADDGMAGNLVRPAINRIFTNLDRLLMGLHYGRQSYLPKIGETTSESHTDRDEELSTEHERELLNRPKAQGRPRGRPKAKRQRRKSAIRDTASLSSDDLDDSSSTRSSQHTQPLKKRKRRRFSSPNSQAKALQERIGRLGLRDWSDILGVASITGWDDDVISRTAARCADLFKEGMMFRTFEEGKKGYSTTSFLPGGVQIEDSGEKGDMDDGKSHHPTASLSDDGKSQDSIASPTIRQYQGTRREDGKLYCPIPNCKRSKKGFSRNVNLQKHLKSTHDREELNNLTRPEDEMFGGVHVDGFLKPIPPLHIRRYRSRSRNASKRNPSNF